MENPVFTAYMQIRFPHHDTAYYAQWEKRFKHHEEWQYSDFEGRRILRRIAPLLYPEDLNSVNPEILCLDDTDEDNPLCKCSACGHVGRLMEDFSYLKAGFNGIQPGDKDDLDKQECGHCQAKLAWNW